MYKISLGYMAATDSCICINDKEYGIESKAWNLLSILRMSSWEDHAIFQSLLRFIYENFDCDLRDSTLKEDIEKIFVQHVQNVKDNPVPKIKGDLSNEYKSTRKVLSLIQ